MGLADISSVVINFSDEKGFGKFILALVLSDAGEKLVIRACENAGYHRDLVRALCDEVKGAKVLCLGGGWIAVNAAKKRIRVWDSSADYGREPRLRTVSLLRKEFPDYTIEAEGL